MFDYSKLYGKIREVFGTQEAFAEAMGMSRTAINARLKQGVEWKTPEIVKACELLGIPLADAHLYFFSLKSLENKTKR
jgi:transcriptional regulator with XRE-family HTH domain